MSDDIDPEVAAWIARAPRVPEPEATRMRELIAERPCDPHDPSQWMTDEEFYRLLARHPEAPRK